MAGTLIVSNLKTDTDNTFIVRSNTGTTLFSANTSGIDIANSIGATAITNDKILSVANTKITGNIISSQITSVANTQITGNIISSQIAPSVTLTTPIISGDLTVTGRITSGITEIQRISASVATSALTISASALTLDFRSNTLGSGTVTTVSGTPANLVISSGSTLGTVNATQSRIVVIAMNNAGTIELAAVNISGGNNLDETTLISTTAEGGAGAADSATVVYSTTARTSVPFRVVGFIQSTQATAGTWATAPSTIQGYGGQALAAMSSLGYGQTWQDVTASRALATTYYNTTGKPITVSASTNSTPSATNYLTLTVGGVAAFSFYYSVGGAQLSMSVVGVVPPGAAYSITGSGLNFWSELR